MPLFILIHLLITCKHIVDIHKESDTYYFKFLIGQNYKIITLNNLIQARFFFYIIES